MKATVLYRFVCMIFQILVWEFFLVYFFGIACTLRQHDPDILWTLGKAWEGQQMFLSPGCLWVPAMKVTRQTGALGFGGLTAGKGILNYQQLS